MSDRLIFTVIAPDRAGLVRQLASLVAAHNGSWVESKLARLGGEFAGIVSVRMPHKEQDRFQAALKKLSDQNITVTFGAGLEEARQGHIHGQLEVTGADRPGIVQDVSTLISQHGVNIDTLETSLFLSSMASQPMFKAEVDIAAPSKDKLMALQDALENLSDELMVDLEVR